MALNTFYGERTVTAGATAVSISALIRSAPGANQAPAFTGSGIGCALSFSSTKDIYVGTDSGVTDSGGGGLLPADTPFTDYGSGTMGNVCDIAQLFIYSAGTDATVTVYYRGI